MNDMSVLAPSAEVEEPPFWPTVGRSGWVPLNALVPNPDQPRKHFDDAELNALAESMKAENGGEQREIMTVALLSEMPWIPSGTYPLPARYMIASGGRRQLAAPIAGLTMLEIRPKRYKNKAAFMLDTWMLNNHRADLSDIENADYMAEMADEFGWTTQQQIAKGLNKSDSWVFNHSAFLKLSAKAREPFSPKIAKRWRPTIGLAVLLARVPHNVQDDLVERMPKVSEGSRVTTIQQIHWVVEQLIGTPYEMSRKTFDSAIMRRLVGYWLRQTRRRASELRATASFSQMFTNVKPGQAEEVIEDWRGTLQMMQRLLLEVEGLPRTQYVPGGKRPKKHKQKDKTKQKPVVVTPAASPLLPREVPSTLPAATSTRPSPRQEQPPPRRSFVAVELTQMVSCDEGPKGYLPRTVTWAQYLQLKKQGVLAYQKMRQTTPMFLQKWEQAHAEAEVRQPA